MVLGWLAAALLATIASTGIAIALPLPLPLGPGIIGAPGGTGPSPAVSEVRSDLPGHSIYRPARLPSSPMPVVIWGNGACRDNGLAYARFLREIASHRYLVIAVGHARQEEPMRPPPAPSVEPVPAGPSRPNRPPDETSVAQLIEGLDWAIAENRRPTSPFYRRIDTAAVAVMGHSCGGLQALAVAADPRVRTALIFNSGIYNSGPGSGRSGIALGKEQLRLLHTPVAYVNGGPADLAYPNARDDFGRIDHVPALFAWQPVGHGGTFFTAPNGGAYAELAVAWLDWQLKARRGAARMFIGPNCGLCRDRSWRIERRGF